MIYRVMLILGLLLMGSLSAGAQDAETRTVFVGPTLVDCTGVAPQKCMQVKQSVDGAYELFYSNIEGFEFEPGYEYELTVEVTPVENPPADAPNETWTLVEVLRMSRALEGTLWQLETYPNADGEQVDTASDTTTLQLSGGEFGGNAGCNSYGGTYTFDGTALQLSDAISTLMACADEAVMTQESQFLMNLSNVASYAFVDDRMQLLDADGNVLMTFSVINPTPLVGTDWVLTGYNNGTGGVVSALEGVEVTATFGEDGQLSGSAGCNSYNATYTADGGTMTIGPAVSTKMACAEPAGVQEQETAYLTTLEGAASFSIRGDVLELLGADGSVLASYQKQTAELVGTMWWWQSFTTSEGETAAVPNPENYAITFNADGTVNLTADCNSGTATYTLDGSEISIQPGAMTLVACAPESLSDTFLAGLQAATTVGWMGESLVLSDANGGTLYFVAA
jgi:heat shock protein HslJ